ncbi:EfeM/EfeO family lipoprotein [Streptomyces hygroscopicus subsp. hygroscopicus]|uniref:EfeM/EfeO family lipoprotein n=1 Tax=Streptomyces hygroscopicus TaxID=1912 RepID=UPI001C6551B4|nr:EfeM/EfeO family lipoprotein [Streptomyces hygroscopicus]MBW8090577.1 EfeM/EfeO family lipoprotein [Streptomyces hygroscopicus subsp. hygroscopicus]
MRRHQLSPVPPARHLLAAGAVTVAAAIGIGALAVVGDSSHRPRAHPSASASAKASDGLRHTSVEVSEGGCGRGWTRGTRGKQVFDLRNTSSRPAEVYLTGAADGAVYGEVEGLGPGTSRPLSVTLGGGSYAFVCLPEDADAVTGPTVTVSGPARGGGPAALPVSQQDLIPPTLAYQKWVAGRMDELVRRTDALRSAVHCGDLTAARAAWLPAHLVYERMGAAYGAFGDADGAINGTTAGLPGGVHDPDFTGFHRLEYGLWHGESAHDLLPVADRLVKDVRGLRDDWAQARMDPADLGLRAHEIMENTVQFELTGRTDYGSGTNLATARANLDGTRAVLRRLEPLLKPRAPWLPELKSGLDRTQRTLERSHHGDRWTPLDRLSRADRARLNADTGALVERLARVAALMDVRRTR